MEICLTQTITFSEFTYKKCLSMVKRIDFEILGIKGFEVKIEALEKSI